MPRVQRADFQKNKNLTFQICSLLPNCNGVYFEIKEAEARCEFFSNANELAFVGPTAADEQRKTYTGDGLMFRKNDGFNRIPVFG